MRTGREYLQGLRDRRRTILLAGQRVDNVVEHPAFAGAARTVASLYDLAADPASDMTYQTESGTRANSVFLIPRSREDLAARRLASTRLGAPHAWLLRPWTRSRRRLPGR